MIHPSRKTIAAGAFRCIALGDIQKPVPKPWLKEPCKRKHIWGVKSRFNRRCSRCGLEEELDTRTGTWGMANKVL